MPITAARSPRQSPGGPEDRSGSPHRPSHCRSSLVIGSRKQGLPCRRLILTCIGFRGQARIALSTRFHKYSNVFFRAATIAWECGAAGNRQNINHEIHEIHENGPAINKRYPALLLPHGGLRPPSWLGSGGETRASSLPPASRRRARFPARSQPRWHNAKRCPRGAD